MAKSCPLRFFDTNTLHHNNFCSGNNCAWYAEEAKQCGIAALGNSSVRKEQIAEGLVTTINNSENSEKE